MEKPVNSDLVSVQNVECTLWQPCFGEPLGDEHYTGWISFRRFGNNGVAAGQRSRKHPRRNHHRKVERRDVRHYAQGLAHARYIDARRCLMADLTLQVLGDATRELDVLQGAQDLA